MKHNIYMSPEIFLYEVEVESGFLQAISHEDTVDGMVSINKGLIEFDDE